MQNTLQFEISEPETIAALKFNQARLLRKVRSPWLNGVFFSLSLAAWFALGFVGSDALAADRSDAMRTIFGLLALAVAVTSASQLHLRTVLFRYLAAQQGQPRELRTLKLDDAGLRLTCAGGDAFFPWSGRLALEELPGQTLLYVDGVSFIQIPQRAFASDAERCACLDWITRRIAHEASLPLVAPDVDTPTAALEADSSGTAAGSAPTFQAVLGLGLRLALFRRPGAAALRPGWSQLVALLALVIGIPLFAGLLSVGWSGHFSAYAVPGVVFILPILTLAAWALTRQAGTPERTLELLVVFLSLSLPIDLAGTVVSQLMEAGTLPAFPAYLRSAPYYLPTVWLVLAATLAAIRLLALPARRWLAAGMAATLLIGAPLSLVYRDRTLWQPAFDAEAQVEQRNRYRALTSEDAFYLQPKLLERQLAALQPGVKGNVDLYFIGAAGDAGQDVFMKEVQSVAQLFEERFASAGRSITLINNARTVAGVPIASSTSLRLALKRVGEVMDRDEDVLFLFLTSHGSEDHRFSLNFGPFQFNPVDPKRLREMIDEAGIKRRVVVVSTCYSGGYIDALKDENTLVITSAASDKTSFGCSNKAEFTYFGKAYFDEALRQTHSFVEAFALATPRIAEREREQDYTPSDARIELGAAIRPVLEKLAQARSETSAPAIAPVASAAAVAGDAVDEYIDMVGLAGVIEQSRLDCRKEMERYSPASTLAEDSAAFGGIKPGASHWPRLIALWERYADDWCASNGDVGLYRKLYGEAWRERFKESGIDAAMQFFKTSSGHRFLATQTSVERTVSGRAMEIRAPLGQQIQRRFMADQAAVVADYQRETERMRAKTRP